MTASETVTIRRLGARGDGIAEDGTAIAFALPGERVAIRRDGGRGELLGIETPSPDRIAPICPYFTRCGGCATQHVAPEPYAAWKYAQVANALAQAGLDRAPDPLIDAHGEGRRRITLHVREVESRAEAGLMAARSHALVAIDHCPITVPALHRAPEIARALSAPLGHGRKPLDVAVTATEAGLDVDLRGHGPVEAGVRATLVRLAGELDLARLSLHGDVVVERKAVTVASGDARLHPPPGGFLQATAAGEATLSGLVRDAFTKKTKRAVDLFSGCGPFTLAMARTAIVHAVESEAGALAGIARSYRSALGLKGVTTEARDLFRRPVLAHDLNGYDAVVFDPPRAGAQAQAKQIAESKVPLAVGVSCDAGTFARDAATLVAAGFGLERVTPVDQFRYSGHVEMVGVFRRAVAVKRRL
ncbi:RNA methyltransferase [Methylobacterium sp. E-041]|uniref:class I SAM-dependent RNA methyltransferase n=1 Tax=Methylobacterium sp. E-041 TaxID=2836573 RepID=UPI001FB89636|nr:RNA methyltransferase [Methylobacterium sp. E-041]MCJ2107650.1 RNA methyltransferase [Methylobacterium sp. E-041]